MAILDVLQFIPPAAQDRTLQAAIAMLTPGAKLVIRTGLEDGGGRARVTRAVDVFSRALGWMNAGPSRYPDADPALARTQAVDWLQTLETRLTHHACLYGDRAALADMAIAPFVRQFAGIDDVWWSAQPWPRLQAWLTHWQASPLFELVMPKLQAWVDGTQGVPFPHSTGMPG